MVITQAICHIRHSTDRPLLTAPCDLASIGNANGMPPPLGSVIEDSGSLAEPPTSLPEPIEDLISRIEVDARGSDDRVIAVAMLVRKLRQRIESGEVGKVTWYEWAPKHIKLSKTRLKELMRIAEAPDPHKEVQRLRGLALERASRFRVKYTKRQPELEPEREILISWAKTAPLIEVKDMAKKVLQRRKDAP